MNEEIKKFFKGDILSDQQTLADFSRDASLFKVTPELVLFPKDSDDVQNLVKWAAKKKKNQPAGTAELSITARSAGTDMTGGPLNNSIILEFTKYMNKLISFEGDRITVEPGMFYRDFKKIAAERGLLLPSYPASESICAIGGMVSNNSGGEMTLKYGKTENYVERLKIILEDGSEHTIKALSPDELQKKMAENSAEGKIYRSISDLINQNKDKIDKAKPQVSKNSSGYYIWNVEHDGLFDLNRLIVGSQGTLGIITEMTFRLVPIAKHTSLVVAYLKDISKVAKLVNEILKYDPESLEAYDDKTLKLAIRFFPSFLKGRGFWGSLKFAWSFWPDLLMLLKNGYPEMVVLAQFAGSAEEVRKKSVDLAAALLASGTQNRIAKDSADAEKYWEIRRQSFNLLRQHVKGKRTAPFIDDLIVRPEFLPEFLPRLEAIIAKYPEFEHTIAGHPGNGNFHIIPLVSPKDGRVKGDILKLSDEVYDLVLKYHGSITAEHNDGIIRTPYLEKMYGKEITDIFKKIKDIFDPLDLFNPGKKTGGTKEDIEKYLNLDK